MASKVLHVTLTSGSWGTGYEVGDCARLSDADKISQSSRVPGSSRTPCVMHPLPSSAQLGASSSQPATPLKRRKALGLICQQPRVFARPGKASCYGDGRQS